MNVNGEQIHRYPTYTIAQKGIGYVPEDQGIFPALTVEENMKVAIKKENEETSERHGLYLKFVS